MTESANINRIWIFPVVIWTAVKKRFFTTKYKKEPEIC